MATSYNPKNVILTFAAQIIKGYAKGTFLTHSFAADAFTRSVGSDGESTLITSNDESSDITITLMHGSKSNRVFNRWLQIAKLTGNALPVPCTLKERGTQTLIASALAYVKKMADVTYQDGEPPNKVWSIGLLDTVANIDAGEELRPFLGSLG